MKLGHIQPELYADSEEQAPATERPHRIRFANAKPWSRIEEARDPRHYESATYICTLEATEWVVYREARGTDRVAVFKNNSQERSMSFMNWCVSHDREIDQYFFEPEQLVALLCRGVMETQ